MDKKGILGEIDEVLREAERFRELKGVIIPVSDELRQLADKLSSLANQLNPSVRIGVSNGKSGMRAKNKAIYDEIYTKMLSGVKVNSDLIQNTYPDLKYFQIAIIMRKLAEAPKVISKREGKKIILFM